MKPTGTIPPDLNRIERYGSGLWACSHPFRLMGIPYGRRMCGVILESIGEHWLFSPAPNSVVQEALDTAQLPPVTRLVAPSIFHDTYLKNCAKTFLQTRIWLAEGMPASLAEPSRTLRINPENLADLPDELAAETLQGMPRVNETVFLHRATGSLIVCDCIFNFDQDYPWLTRTFARSMGIFGKPSTSPLFRALIRDRQAFCVSLERVLAWDFDRILPAHGKVVEQGGKAVFQRLLERFQS